MSGRIDVEGIDAVEIVRTVRPRDRPLACAIIVVVPSRSRTVVTVVVGADRIKDVVVNVDAYLSAGGISAGCNRRLISEKRGIVIDTAIGRDSAARSAPFAFKTVGRIIDYVAL